jgi:hypothetical protein
MATHRKRERERERERWREEMDVVVVDIVDGTRIETRRRWYAIKPNASLEKGRCLEP